MPDFLVFPILFNYRQYIELSLKSIIRDARRLLNEPGDAPQTHDLHDLWTTGKPLLLRAEPLDSAEMMLSAYLDTKAGVPAFSPHDFRHRRISVAVGGSASKLASATSP